MWPPLLTLEPASAASALEYRFNRLPGAEYKAAHCGEPNHVYCPPNQTSRGAAVGDAKGIPSVGYRYHGDEWIGETMFPGSVGRSHQEMRSTVAVCSSYFFLISWSPYPQI